MVSQRAQPGRPERESRKARWRRLEEEDAVLDEASLPSTLFYGVRGQQV